MTTSRNGLTGSVTQAWRMVVQIGSLTPAMSAICVDQPAVQAMTVSHAMAPRFGLHAGDAAVLDVDARHLDALVDLGAVPVGRPRVAPDDRVVADDPAGRVIEGAVDRPGAVRDGSAGRAP